MFLSYFINRLAFEIFFFFANLNLRNVSSVSQIPFKFSLFDDTSEQLSRDAEDNVDSKMNLCFTYESRDILKLFAFSITVKTITKSETQRQICDANLKN